MCVGGLGSELAEWVPHVRALCFDGSDTFEGDKCFFLYPRYFIASLNASLCVNFDHTADYAVLAIDFVLKYGIFFIVIAKPCHCI